MVENYDWYKNLIKPSWTPEPGTIGLIWTLLYPIIIGSLIFVIYKTWTREWPWHILLIFGLNLLFNILFTPIQFGLKNLPLAAVDILLVLVTILLEIYFVWPYSKVLALAQIPYLVWVSTATILQLSITRSNS